MNLQNTQVAVCISMRRMRLELLFSQGRMLKESPERTSLGRRCAVWRMSVPAGCSGSALSLLQMMSPYEPGSQKRTSSVFTLLLQLCKRKWNHCCGFLFSVSESRRAQSWEPWSRRCVWHCSSGMRNRETCLLLIFFSPLTSSFLLLAFVWFYLL